MTQTAALSATLFTFMAMPAMAGTVVPLPLAGAAGPLGLVVAVGGYAAYRVLRARK